MAKVGSWKWEGKEKIRKDRDLADARDVIDALNEREGTK